MKMSMLCVVHGEHGENAWDFLLPRMQDRERITKDAFTQIQARMYMT
jgi:hypothetical protein